MSPAKTEMMLRNALKSSDPPSLEDEDTELSDEFLKLIKLILLHDHRKRITSADVLKSKWFQLHDISSLHDAVRIVRDYGLSACPINPMYLLSLRCTETPSSNLLQSPTVSL